MSNLAFCGFIGAGKSTIAKRLIELRGGRIESVASPLKIFCQEILDILEPGLLESWKKLKKPEHRDFMIFIGEKLRDSNFGFEDFWINKVNLNPSSYIYIDDLRHLNEAEILKQHNFLIVKLHISEEEQQKRLLIRDGKYDPAIRTKSSEISHLMIQPDITITVDGKSIDKVCNEILSNLKQNSCSEERII